MLSTVEVAGKRAGAAAFLGQPRGLFYLAFTEAWERFSFYGMTALVVLYMVNQLLLPGHVEHIGGFAGFRAVLESLTGPLSTQALASQVFGLYSGLVYFTPLLGGMIADRWIGQRNAVVIGALSMSAGHIAMTFDQSFLLALLLLVIGSGFLKGNISAQVGALYPPEDEARRTRGFVIFSTGINIGAVAGPLLCGLLAQLYGWHYGFGIAALFMLLGLATYLYGYRYLPARVERRKFESATRLTATERRIIIALIAVMIISIFESIAYGQIFNVNSIWIQQHVALDMGGFRIPVPWFQSINSVFSIASVPLLFWIWRQQALRGREPNELAKIGTGAFLAAASNLILVLAILLSGSAPVHPLWPFLYSAGLGISFLYYWPTLLALVSRAAPAKMNATMMGLAFMSLFVANTIVGRIGGFYEKMTPAQFWAMHAAIAAVGGLLVVVFGRRLTRGTPPGAKRGAETMKIDNFFSELKRRNVYKVAVAYAVVGWLLVQVATQVFPFFEIPNWAVRLVVLAIVIGFPVALVIAWAFELTPQGLTRTEDVDLAAQGSRKSHAWIYVVIAGALLSIGLIFVGRYTASRTAEDGRPGGPSLPQKSIAVLPFENQNHDPDADYLCEGIPESIINSLSELPKLKVMSRNSVFHYKGKNVNAQMAGKELKVQTLLTGRVRQRGDGLTIGVELINTEDNSQLWGQQYSRKLADVFAVQEEIAKEVSQKLRLKLTGAEQEQLAKRPTENLKAFQYYMQGRAAAQRRTNADLRASINYFERALQEDGKYALAYAGLADAYANLGYYGSIAPIEGRRKAEEAARKALALDENLAEAHAALGQAYIAFAPSNFPAGDRELQHAIELSPNLAVAHYNMGLSFIRQGRLDEASAELLKARELDPLSSVIARAVAIPHYFKRDYARAFELLRQANELGPPLSATWEIGLYIRNGSVNEAFAELEKAKGTRQNDTLVIYSAGMAYAASGKQAEARESIKELEAMGGANLSTAHWIAKIYATLNDKEMALSWLERGLATGALGVFYKDEPVWDPIRDDPRFEELVGKMVVPETAPTQ